MPMSAGPQTTIDLLSQKLLRRWVPKWYGAFCESETGLFYERVGHAFMPLKTGKRRLLTQCRQLSVYAHAAAQKDAPFSPDLTAHFEALVHYYREPEQGGWIFALDDDLKPVDRHYDLYAHAFVIFALAHYYRATKDTRASQYALDTLSLIDRHFRAVDAPGFCEAIGQNLEPIPQTRRHESHMHLLEACLFAYETFQTDGFLAMADTLVGLFEDCFYQADHNRLSEYYDDQLLPQKSDGHYVLEPGHYAEWIWLLKKYQNLTTKTVDVDIWAAPMLLWANKYGWDQDYGGIFDELNEENKITSDTKRIWPFTEALKANALMLNSELDRYELKNRIRLMMGVFRDHYMDERGFWTEWLNRDLSPATDYMPGTTPYHVYFGVMESRLALKSRGQSKSLRAFPALFYYKIRRHSSDFMRKIRTKISSSS
jgi:mannose-6-phosphate isomerase